MMKPFPIFYAVKYLLKANVNKVLCISTLNSSRHLPKVEIFLQQSASLSIVKGFEIFFFS